MILVHPISLLVHSSFLLGAIGIVGVVVVLSCVRLCNPMDCSKPGFSVFHCLLESAQIHVH